MPIPFRRNKTFLPAKEPDETGWRQHALRIFKGLPVVLLAFAIGYALSGSVIAVALLVILGVLAMAYIFGSAWEHKPWR